MGKFSITTKLFVGFIVVVSLLYGYAMFTRKPVDTADVTPTPTIINEDESVFTTGEELGATDTTSINYTGREGKTVLELLKENYPDAIIQDSQYGQYVSELNGIMGGTNDKYWIFYVNGAMGDVGAGEYITKNTDTIEWRFE